MRYSHITWIIILVATASAQQTNVALDVEKGWLLKVDSFGETVGMKSRILSLGATIEPDFINAVNDGPPPDLLAKVQVITQTAFDETNALLQSGETFGLDPQYLGFLQNRSRDSFLSEALDKFILRYKLRAIAGLAVVSGPAGKALLKTLSSDPTSPLRAAALDAYRTRLADTNSDGQIDCKDIRIVIASFGKKKGQPKFDARADVNGDGIVNALDVLAVAIQITPGGSSCPLQD